MVSAQEVKGHINSVKKTQKITNAMYLIASTKLQKARKDFENTYPYFDALVDEIKGLLRRVYNVMSPYFYVSDSEPESMGTYGILVITADKGLAGSYNENVIRQADILLSQHEKARIFVIGEYGRNYYESKGIPIEENFRYSSDSPTIETARAITERLLTLYDSGKISKIFLAFTEMKKTAIIAKTTRMLPFHRNHFKEENQETDRPRDSISLVPSAEDVLDGLIRSYLNGYIYSALVESYCSEQKARMDAMSTANENAQELLEDLTRQFNLARQAAITQEITEISAGALAQRNVNERM